MGTAGDRRLRRNLPRVDDEAKRNKVKKARARIYEGNYAVDNDEVEHLLKDQSLTPTAVGGLQVSLWHLLTISIHRTHFQSSLDLLDSTYSKH